MYNRLARTCVPTGFCVHKVPNCIRTCETQCLGYKQDFRTFLDELPRLWLSGFVEHSFQQLKFDIIAPKVYSFSKKPEKIDQMSFSQILYIFDWFTYPLSEKLGTFRLSIRS